MPARGRRKHREMEDLPQRYAEAIDPCLSEEEDGETLQGEALEEEDGETLQRDAPEVKNKARLHEENKETLPAEAHEVNEDASIEASEETASKKQYEVTLQTEATRLNKDAASEECKETLQGEVTEVKEEVDSSEKSKDTSETEATELKEEADTAGLSESETGTRNSHSMENAREKEMKLTEETKTRKVNRWAKTRPALRAIENLMSLRVKRKNMKNRNMNGSECHLPSVKEARSSERESEVEFEEKVCVNEISATEGSNADNEAYDESFFPWKEELQSLVHGGVPKDLRGEVWQAFVGVKARRVKRYYNDLLAQENNDDDDQHSNSPGVFRKWRKQIEKDLPRTFPGHPALNDRGRDTLRRLLLAYARHNPSVGYCQAMNFFAGLLLLLMPEENAFWTLVGIIDDYFDGYYTEEMIESQVDQLVFEELMRERFPKLVNHLDYLGVQVAWISTPWFLSIFVNMLPWESVLRIWDVILFEGNRVMLFRTALALMELHSSYMKFTAVPALVTTKDAGDVITMLQSLAGSTFDSSQLVLTACMGFLAVTEGKLQKLREKHRPTVLMIVKERAQGAQVSKNSKGIATKLYSFKQNRGQEETNPAEDDGNGCKLEPRSSDLDKLLCSLNADLEVGSLPSLRDQVDRMKVELCRLLEEKRAAILRADELEIALMELTKEDNRQELNEKIEQLEQEVADQHQALAFKREQEAAMLKVLEQLEQEQRIVEEARKKAEKEAAALREANAELQEKYEKALASNAEMQKRVVMAESMLEATLQYESGQAKPQTSQTQRANSGRKGGGILSFGLGLRDKIKGIHNVEEPTDGKSNQSATEEETNTEDGEKNSR
ncbi:hypothetical protein GOBAR_AA40048 [Gossypium barbadense]|uniref:Rab-GAP TBC domain-containing protein n=1 Tax=Gossypium barbadense TaxID=3634 RepID=A0A2P5VP93_GOSBA|nr:hypothetical protein GOBAR_AA40048 [Gossypium barbadense]